MKTLLRFQEVFNPGVTKRVEVYSMHSQDYLGLIHWQSTWRCYVMSYEPDTIMSASCMVELVGFMQKLEDERKEKKE